MKRVFTLLLIVVMAFSLSACGQPETVDYDSISDFLDAYRYTSLRDEEHPENFFYELGHLLPLDESAYSEWSLDSEMTEMFRADGYYNLDTRVIKGDAEISLLIDNSTRYQDIDIMLDMNGSEFAEAYFLCKKISENVENAKIEIDGKEAHIGPLNQLYNDFDYTKPFSIKWDNDGKVGEKRIYYSIKYSYYKILDDEYIHLYLGVGCFW